MKKFVYTSSLLFITISVNAQLTIRPGDGSVIIRSYTEIMNKEKMITEPSPGHERF